MITPNQIRKLLEVHGTCEPQDPSQWTGDIPLPEAIASFYRDIGPVDVTIEGFGNPMFIPSLSQLWEYQAGYRWNAITGEPIAEWKSDWIVIADEGADPYIFSDGKVLFAYHGAGAWAPSEVYQDLNTMAACVATLGQIVLREGQGFLDDEFLVRAEFKSEAMNRLTEILGDPAAAEAIIATAGWE